MTKVVQHIAFSMFVRNVDAADPRYGTETELSFGGVAYDEAEGDPKEAAILHVSFNVCHNEAIVKEYGKIYPLPRTFKLNSIHTPSDQHLA